MRVRFAVLLATVPALILPAATAATAATGPGSVANAGTITTCPTTCLQGIRAATHTGYDRLVFDLTNKTQYTTWTNTTGEYIPMSGQTQYLDAVGDSYLFVRMEPANVSADYVNPPVQEMGLPTIKGVQLTSFHAGTSEFGISLGPSTRYNVFTLTQPDRLVVDVYR
ncbi:AMIN-like domain-containing (lipo)protein [Streptomyces sp. IBSBF 3010]|uniref:AMIN-like domain-containing (lipo)protein n=1 Tax=Streptomyces sp. IBSBF 3010 TaxID=2903526 RepID=UPI002FDBC386